MDEKLRELIDHFKEELTLGEACSAQDIEKLQIDLDVTLPESYRAFLQEYGFISGSFCDILGLTQSPKHPSNIVFAKHLIQSIYPDLPGKLIPLENIDQDRIVFMDLTDADQGSPILEINFIDPDRLIQRVISDDFEAYLCRRLSDEKHFRFGSKVLDEHVAEFEKSHVSASTGQLKIPRVHEWRPYRLCVQDIFLGLTVFKHDRVQNFHEVDVFLTASIPEYEFDSGVKGLTLAILSDAFRCGSSMEIHFSGEVEGGTVPMELRELAGRLNLNLQKADEGIILPAESEQLYFALSDPGQELTKTLENLPRKASPLLLSFAINSGIWDRNELLYLIQTAEYPERVLAGEMDPEDRLLYRQDLIAGRNALIAGQIDRRLRYRHHRSSEGEYHIESDQKPLKMNCFADINALSWNCDEEPLEIDGSVKVLPEEKRWLEQEAASYSIPQGRELIILLRARERYHLRDLKSDFAEASALKERFPDAVVFVLVTRDIEKMDRGSIEEVLQQNQSGIGLIMQKDFCTQMDDDVNQRLRSTRGLRSI